MYNINLLTGKHYMGGGVHEAWIQNSKDKGMQVYGYNSEVYLHVWTMYPTS